MFCNDLIYMMQLIYREFYCHTSSGRERINSVVKLVIWTGYIGTERINGLLPCYVLSFDYNNGTFPLDQKLLIK